MTRTLLLMRHAKSSWATDLRDVDRPLNARGQRDAPRIAAALDARGLRPAHVLCSEAERTRETLAWLEHAWGTDVTTTFLGRLYLPSIDDLLDAVAEAPPDADPILVLSHNPGTEDLVSRWTGTPTRMPTGAVAVCEAVGVWADAARAAGRITVREILRPRDLDP